MNNIEVFWDTMDRIKNNEELRRRTERSKAGTRVYDEGFVSHKVPAEKDMKVSFEESLTLITARRFAESEKTAVLNFSNPLEPGGGVLRGAGAQEEYLCRATNLYPCLTSYNAAEYYYEHNKEVKDRIHGGIIHGKETIYASDRVIYSPGITVIREDTGYRPDSYRENEEYVRPTQTYTDNWVTIDVLTCAAPAIFVRSCAPSDGELKELLRRRIRNIFEAAIDNDAEALILGAFGCGVFNNPPGITAGAFRDVLLEDRYRHAFSDVVFAVERTSRYSENIEAFETAFSRFPQISLSVQMANNAVHMYERAGFGTVQENDDEYIMECGLLNDSEDDGFDEDIHDPCLRFQK